MFGFCTPRPQVTLVDFVVLAVSTDPRGVKKEKKRGILGREKHCMLKKSTGSKCEKRVRSLDQRAASSCVLMRTSSHVVCVCAHFICVCTLPWRRVSQRSLGLFSFPQSQASSLSTRPACAFAYLCRKTDNQFICRSLGVWVHARVLHYKDC